MITRKSLYLLLTFMGIFTMNQAHIFIFDIHGVLLRINRTQWIKQQLDAYEQQPQKSDLEQQQHIKLCKEYGSNLGQFVGTSIKEFTAPPGFEFFDKGEKTCDECLVLSNQLIEKKSFDDHVQKFITQKIAQSCFDIPSFLEGIEEISFGSTFLSSLKKKHPKGHQFHILSNGRHEWLPHYKKTFPHIFNCFKSIVISSEVHLTKPQKEIFQFFHFFSEGIKTFFFDDSPKNIAMANKYGMIGILFDPDAGIVDFETLKQHGVFAEQEIIELKNLLANTKNIGIVSSNIEVEAQQNQ